MLYTPKEMQPCQNYFKILKCFKRVSSMSSSMIECWWSDNWAKRCEYGQADEALAHFSISLFLLLAPVIIVKMEIQRPTTCHLAISPAPALQQCYRESPASQDRIWQHNNHLCFWSPGLHPPCLPLGVFIAWVAYGMAHLRGSMRP